MKLKKVLRNDYILLVLIAMLEIVFFRNIIFNDGLLGNQIDGKLLTMICEHWYQTFCGNEHWNQLPIFYPTEGVLSYTDLMFGFAIPFSGFRLFHINKFIAFKASAILIHICGTYAMYFLGKKCFRLQSVYAFIGVIAFSYSRGYIFAITNVQMMALSILPFMLLLFYKYVEFSNNTIKYLYASLFVLLLALQFYTAFYVAYYILLAMALYGVLFFIYYLMWGRQDETVYRIWIYVWKNKVEILLYVILFVLCMHPFIYIYLPTLKTMGGRSWEAVLMFSPTLKATLGLENENLLQFDEAFYNVNVGFPILELCILVLSGFIAYKKIKNSQIIVRKILYASLVSLTGLLIVLPIKFNGMSLWYVFWKIIPGASGLRQMDRLLSFATFFVAILLAVNLQYTFCENKSFQKLFTIICIILVYVLNFSTIGVSSTWNAQDELQKAKDLTKIPDDCEVFFVSTENKNMGMHIYSLQMDAWVIASDHGKKTLNGYSGQTPLGWELWIDNEDYYEQIDSWIITNEIDVEKVYEYKVEENKWVKYKATNQN